MGRKSNFRKEIQRATKKEEYEVSVEYKEDEDKSYWKSVGVFSNSDCKPGEFYIKPGSICEIVNLEYVDQAEKDPFYDEIYEVEDLSQFVGQRCEVIEMESIFDEMEGRDIDKLKVKWLETGEMGYIEDILHLRPVED